MLNGIDVVGLKEAAAAAEADPSSAERKPTLRARWLGADRTVAEIEGKSIEISGPGNLDAMQLVLAAFAGCEIEVVATWAAMMGLEVQSIDIEIDAHFDLRVYLGLDGQHCGYDSVGYVVRVHAPGITEEQVRELERAVEHSSPVGATLANRVPLTSRLEIVRERASG